MTKALPVAIVAFLIATAVHAAEPTSSASTPAIRITRVEQTPLFPRPADGQPLMRLIRVHLDNPGAAVPVTAELCSGTGSQRAWTLAKGKSSIEISVTDVAQPIPATIKLVAGDGKTLATARFTLQPQKKWNIYCVAYSHHDLGYGDYPHRLRTSIRHANIERPLQFCRETDSWDDDSKFRFMIETSEPITSFLGSHSEADATELARRVREGRIQIGAFHSTVNTEQLGHELMARLFYLTNRHTRDLLGVPASRTAQIDDVIGLTWPLATFCAEADVPYCFHGPNLTGHCLMPAELEPVFYWQGPDRRGRVLMRSTPYGGYAGDNPGDMSESHILDSIKRLGPRWPYDAMLLQEGTDFRLVTMDTAKKIRQWNKKWAYPRMICGTMDMFFDDLAKQADPRAITSFAKDSNNEWADQDSTDAWLLARARRADEAVPTAEKFATIAQTVAGGSYPWTDIYQAYHRLLSYHEHTNAIDFVDRTPERLRRYETELEENREMVIESQEFAGRALDGALNRLTAAITRKTDRTIIVFNPLTRKRTDIVRLGRSDLSPGDHLVDSVTKQDVPWQQMPDGRLAFVANDVPSLGYRSYVVAAGGATRTTQELPDSVLENDRYRVRFDRKTGAIASIHAKRLNRELVDQESPHRFNEYLYERHETGDKNIPATWYRVQSAKLKHTSGPLADVMEVTANPVGVENLKQTIILYHGLDRIDFVLDIVKSPSGRNSGLALTNLLKKESVYVALPLAVPNHHIRHELPGCVARPIDDLFDGANTAFYAVRHFSDVSNDRYGVTVSAPESSLVEYNHPRSCPIEGDQALFERSKTPIATSRMYLYLMDNMFNVNIRWDQPGPVRFTYSLRSHEGDWQSGHADQFGWDTMNPLLARAVVGRSEGRLPAASCSFVAIDQPNVVCTTIKPAEANGAGLILRLVETEGRETLLTVSLPLLREITSANETNLVEDDRPRQLPVKNRTELTVALRPFGVKTIRVQHRPARGVAAITGIEATPHSDKAVALRWHAETSDKDAVSYFRVYRSTTRDFRPSPLHLVQRPEKTSCIDHPQLNYGGWINNRLQPATTYFYRVAAVDPWNNEGPLSPVVQVSTPKSSEKHRPPLRVECLRAILVSPLDDKANFVNLLFRTSCEPDVVRYEIHRSTTPDFTASDATLVGTVGSDEIPPASGGYGETAIKHRNKDYDHAMFADKTVAAGKTYYYKVRAIDTFGQMGPCSAEATVATLLKGKP